MNEQQNNPDQEDKASEKLATTAYKGVRDFYPADMAVQQYIFDTWSKTAESFGFRRYDTSILEPSALYKAKGAQNEEMVNEQTYTFTDRGDREVTLRPEMTPSVARLIAARARELAFPVRWYSIPNLFRYERPQRGRLREHWQLNCDIFGSDALAVDVEVILLAQQVLLDFGAKPEQFVIKLNHKVTYANTIKGIAEGLGKTVSEEQIAELSRLTDKFHKLSESDYRSALLAIFIQDTIMVEKINNFFRSTAMKNTTYYDWAFGGGLELEHIENSLKELNVKNVSVDPTLMRGFDYYTGTIFEIFEVDADGNSTGRSLIGGGRYDNLTQMFGGEPVSGVGFGMGDVTMRDFLETHDLLPDNIDKAGMTLAILPESAEQHLFAEQTALAFRKADHSTIVDLSTKNISKKINSATENNTRFVIVVGEREFNGNELTLKNLLSKEETIGTVDQLLETLSSEA